MYVVQKQCHPPTGIEHAIYCNFFSTKEKNLVTAGVNQLNVYRLYADIESDISLESLTEKDLKSKKCKLECLASYPLFGNIMSLQSVKLAGAHRDALLLSFIEAKLSLVEYDPGTHDLKTSSLHYFEDPELKEGRLDCQDIPLIRVDPDGRCAAMLIYGNKLVVLPFRREVNLEDADPVIGSGKSPIMSSYIIDLKNLDERITNVLDVQFLHGYFEPTVFILYEPLRTWSGRTAVRTDTCCIVAISLNIQEKVHPIIWSLSSLPFDCFQALPVPKPVGGVLVFAVNSLLYLNQSVPPYGVSVNSITDQCSAFPLRPQDGVRMSLDCAQAALISNDKLVLSLKGGELYVLTLVVDGMRSVRSFHFDKAASSVLTTCMCLCEEGYLFLGSRLGNSLLLKYTEKAGPEEPKPEPPPKKQEPPAKKKKLDTGEVMASDISQLDDLDELEVYGSSESQAGTTILSFVFEVCDSILNIGPCGQITMGEPAFLSEEFSHSIDPDLELVTTSGYGKNGALSVLQRTVRPQVVTTFELPGCVDMWTVFGPKTEIQDDEKKDTTTSEKEDISDMGTDEGTEETPAEGSEDNSGDATVEKADAEEKNLEGAHAFLIMSRGESTMILQTGQEIMELDHSGFSTQSPTIYASNIGDDKYIVQVSPMGVRLLEGVNQLQHIPIDIGSPIVHCSVADPYVIIRSAEGQLMLLTLREDTFGTGVRLSIVKPQLNLKSKIIAMCAYKDVSGMFTTSISNMDADKPVEVKTPKSAFERSFSLDKSNIDDEDEMLYGDTDTSTFNTSMEEAMREEKSGLSMKVKKVQPTYWTAVCHENGSLEIFSLPDFKLCYYVKSFPIGAKVLVDSGQVIETSKSSTNISGDKPVKETQTELPRVSELLLVGLGNRNSRPYLMARVEEELLLYEAFPFYHSKSDANHLKIRFKKIQHNLILRERKSQRMRKKGDNPVVDEELSTAACVAHLRYFEDVSGYSGVFVCGACPYWLFMTPRGALRTHPMNIDGPVTCFSTFNNVNCPKGFLYFNKQGELRISVLPTHLTYDSPWPMRKIPLRCTPHFITYHQESKTYSVVTSTSELSNRVVRVVNDEKDFEVVEKDDRFVYPYIDKFSVQLFTPVSWEIIPNARIDLEEFEHATCLKHVSLKSEGTVSGLKGYIAVATNYSYGEELHSRGRIIIYDIIEVVPEPGQPLTKNKIKLIYEKEQKGPVTALAQVNGFLISAIGQKLFMWTLKDNDLMGVAFIDTHIYIHTLVTLKNLILAGDLLKSITVYRYQTDMKVLSVVSRDIKPKEVYSTEFLVDNTQLGFIISDRNKNFIEFSYQPEARESHGGQRLLRKGDFNIGSAINTMFRVRCRLSDFAGEKKAQSLNERRHITYYASLDGGMGFLLPIPEKVYRRLLMLQNALVVHIPHTAGLNPRNYRILSSSRPELYNPQRNILDGDLLWKFINLGVTEQLEIAKRIGTTNEQIVDDMLDIDRLTAHF